VEILENSILKGLIDTHIHTSPDIKPRLLNDHEAALSAKEHGMKAIVIKSHVESTVGRAYLTQRLTGLRVLGGVTLNLPMGGLNLETVKNVALMGGKLVWLPTIHHNEVKMEQEILGEILDIIANENLVLGTGHTNPPEIFHILDECHSRGIKKIMVNHPLTPVVGASIDQQREMARRAYLEHCWVATMPKHGNINPILIAEVIKEVGAKNCILATDFGQKHNPKPADGMKMMIETLLGNDISWKEIKIMCMENPLKLLF